VTKLIKLTNDADAHKGNPIYINADQITAIFESPSQSGGMKTFIFGGYTGVQWEVEESPKQIADMITPVEYL